MKKQNLRSLKLNIKTVSALTNLYGGTVDIDAADTRVMSCLRPTEEKGCRPPQQTLTYCGIDCVGATGAFC